MFRNYFGPALGLSLAFPVRLINILKFELLVYHNMVSNGNWCHGSSFQWSSISPCLINEKQCEFRFAIRRVRKFNSCMYHASHISCFAFPARASVRCSGSHSNPGQALVIGTLVCYSIVYYSIGMLVHWYIIPLIFYSIVYFAIGCFCF